MLLGVDFFPATHSIVPSTQTLTQDERLDMTLPILTLKHFSTKIVSKTEVGENCRHSPVS